MPEVKVNRPLKINALAAVGDKLVENFLSYLLVALKGLIVFHGKLMGTAALRHHFVVEGFVYFARKHFLVFGHEKTPFFYRDVNIKTRNCQQKDCSQRVLRVMLRTATAGVFLSFSTVYKAV